MKTITIDPKHCSIVGTPYSADQEELDVSFASGKSLKNEIKDPITIVIGEETSRYGEGYIIPDKIRLKAGNIGLPFVG